jgi:hypothetical protein
MASRADKVCQAIGAPVTGIVTAVAAIMKVSFIVRTEPSGAAPRPTS